MIFADNIAGCQAHPHVWEGHIRQALIDSPIEYQTLLRAWKRQLFQTPIELIAKCQAPPLQANVGDTPSPGSDWLQSCMSRSASRLEETSSLGSN